MTWLITAAQYPLPNPRIDGWKKLAGVHGRTNDMSVFSLETFDYFQKNGILPPEFEAELLKRAGDIIKSVPSHAAVVRRAYVVPGLENPPGPRFLGLDTPEKVLQSARDLYDFAIKHEYNKDSKSQISGWIETPTPLLDEESFKKDPTSVFIPYGGYAVCDNNAIEIFAVFGINEGVQTLVADRYLVEVRNRRFFINHKEIPQKNLMLCTTQTSQSLTFQVPFEMQFDQVLSDSEIIEVARVVFELSQKFGPQRVEFSTDEQGIFFNEVSDYFQADDKVQANLKIQGTVLLVNGPDDLNKLSNIDPQKIRSGEVIVLVGEKVILSRNYDVLGTLASWRDQMYVLYPGVAATQHAMRILADKGHKAFLVGSQKFSEGDKVQISSTGGKVRVVNLSRTENQLEISLWDASILGTSMSGGKANRLSQLKTYGFQVPHGSVVTTLLFDQILKEMKVKKLTLDNFSSLEKQLLHPDNKLISMVEHLLPDYQKGGKKYSVRSSATVEDSRNYSLAGIFESYLEVPGNKLGENVLKVMASTFSSKAKNYLRHHPNLVSELKMAVIIQEMVDPKTSGVIFGAKVQTGDTDIVELEANIGLGESLVSGKAQSVESFVFSRQDRRVIEQKGPNYLSQSEARALFMLSERLRNEFSGVPQDIEWAIDKQNQIWVLQSRDLSLA